MENKKKDSDAMTVVVIVVIVLAVALLIGLGNKDKSRYEPGGKDYGANFDYGDDYYWDTNEHKVKHKAWK